MHPSRPIPQSVNAGRPGHREARTAHRGLALVLYHARYEEGRSSMDHNSDAPEGIASPDGPRPAAASPVPGRPRPQGSAAFREATGLPSVNQACRRHHLPERGRGADVADVLNAHQGPGWAREMAARLCSRAPCPPGRNKGVPSGLRKGAPPRRGPRCPWRDPAPTSTGTPMSFANARSCSTRVDMPSAGRVKCRVDPG